MFICKENVTQVWRKIDNINNCIAIVKRYTHGKDHWSSLRRKNKPKDKALAHFDDFYASIYGSTWQYIRAAMLKETNKHVAIVNNFSDVEANCEKLSLLGAMNMKELYDVHKQNYEERTRNRLGNVNCNNVPQENQSIDKLVQYKQTKELQAMFPDDYNVPEKIERSNKNTNNDNSDSDKLKSKSLLDPVKLRPMEEDLLKLHEDENRIILPSIGMSSPCLYEYIPATKLKGLDDYVLESEYYSHYSKASDFAINIENEAILRMPEHLKIYTFDSGNDSRFPTPRRAGNDVYNYYLMDGGSILPVLALDLHKGDTVLDMCAAPGGKSLAILQTLMSYVLVSNDSSLSRVNHMNQIFLDYLGDYDIWHDKLYLTNHDARAIEDKNIYNKILVDVPCTTDRHNLHNDENNIFSPSRIKDRLQMPELQTEILLQALKIVAPGGTVVYSTCSLSPIQNDGVVQMALKKCWEETGSTMIVKNMNAALGPLQPIYKFVTDCGLKYGHIVIPTKNNNWGPMYFCKIVKLP